MVIFTKKKQNLTLQNEDLSDTFNMGKPETNIGNSHKFDLNIEKILENWEVYHAIREIISNALYEQILTATKEIEIENINC